ncbi:MAG: hypothetical protein P8M49_10515 [Thalassotalea sp.]|nr:hypothetical protein [Thalassotalea sp.]MDG2393936.1 hypothetical protein [Thalassotalea sp.]
MKTTTRFILATTVALLSASSFALTDKEQKKFDRKDTNGDGYIQPSEQRADATKNFESKGLTGEALATKVDKNVKMWMKRDKNNDGKVDSKEYVTKNKNKNKNKSKNKNKNKNKEK